MIFLKKYWAELLVFGVIFAVLIIDLNPDYTFVNKAADSIGYIYSAKYMYPAYHTSAPLYLLVSHLFLQIPYGTEAWRMGLVSVLSTMGACVFIYLIIMKLTKKRFYSLLGVLIYGLSALVISQSIIVNTYALVCFLAIGAYYFILKKQWKLMGLMLGLGIAVHLLGFIVLLVMLVAYKDYRKNWKALAITAGFLLFYLYIPITNRPPYMWMPNPAESNSFLAFFGNILSIIAMLIGTISVWDLPKRILDTIGIVGVSVGIITLVPIIYYWLQKGKKCWLDPLFWLAFLPIILFVSELDMNTFDYTMVAMPFLAIVACLGLRMIVKRYGNRARNFGYASLVIVVGLGIFNANYFDIGRTLDPHLAASEYYYTELGKLPSNAIYMPNGAWNWEAVYKYDKDYNKNIYPICIDILPSSLYRDSLEKDGIKLIPSDNPNPSIAASDMAKSIVALNDNVWTTITTNSATFAVEVVPANHDTDLISSLDMAIVQKNITNPGIRWKPFNPYDILTTSVYADWNYVILSTYNFRLFVALWLGVYFILTRFGRRKKKESGYDELFKVSDSKGEIQD